MVTITMCSPHTPLVILIRRWWSVYSSTGAGDGAAEAEVLREGTGWDGGGYGYGFCVICGDAGEF